MVWHLILSMLLIQSRAVLVLLVLPWVVVTLLLSIRINSTKSTGYWSLAIFTAPCMRLILTTTCSLASLNNLKTPLTRCLRSTKSVHTWISTIYSVLTGLRKPSLDLPIIRTRLLKIPLQLCTTHTQEQVQDTLDSIVNMLVSQLVIVPLIAIPISKKSIQQKTLVEM